MKFDQVCNLVLGEAKEKGAKFEKLVVGNTSPTFTKEDILRDPTDPTKGTKLYLATKEQKTGKLLKDVHPGDPQAIRRQIRRLNWIAKTIIKKYGKRQAAFSLDEMNNIITELLNKYQVNILGQSKPDKANTGYEARVIGNLLLPPTKRNPSGKSVLIVPGMDPNATVEDADKPVTQKRKDRKTGKLTKSDTVTASDVVFRFNQIADFAEDVMDPDLAFTVTRIVKDGNVTMKDVLRDERIKNVFDERAVKFVIKKLKDGGKFSEDENGILHMQSGVTPTTAKFLSQREEEDIKDVKVPDLTEPEKPEEEELALLGVDDEEDEEEDEEQIMAKAFRRSSQKPSWYPGKED